MHNEGNLTKEHCTWAMPPNGITAPECGICPQEDDEDDDDEEDDEELAADAIQIDEGIAKKGGVQIDVGVPAGGVQVDAGGAGKRKGAGAEAQKSKRSALHSMASSLNLSQREALTAFTSQCSLPRWPLWV